MGQADAEAAVEALSILAKGFLTSQQTSQAVKCLEAICRSSVLMPVPAAKARLWLAQVLLQHTQNIAEATQHLQQAVSAWQSYCIQFFEPLHRASTQKCVALQQFCLKQVHACHPLKCEVLSELGQCHRYLARHKLELQQYERGIEVTTTGNPSSDK